MTANSNIRVGGNVYIGDFSTYSDYFEEQIVTIPHRLTTNIPYNADYILGRVVELAAIQGHFDNNRSTILINGIGGIGKTSVATKFMIAYGSHYSHLAWLSVEHSLEEAFINNYNLLSSLQIVKQVQELMEKKQLKEAFELIINKLNQLEQTLVVIDNANDLEDLLEHKDLFDQSKAQFLITSRCHPLGWTTVTIDALPEAEALYLFKKLYPSVSATDNELKTLLSKLFYHTLLIELVAKASQSSIISFEELRTSIEQHFIHQKVLNEEIISTGRHGYSLSENAKRANIEEYIWFIYSRLIDLGDDSKIILKGLSLIPLAMSFDLKELKTHLSLWNLKEITSSLKLLVERGWIEKIQESEQKPRYRLHPLIADVAVKHLDVNVVFAEPYIQRIADLIKYDSLNTKHNLFEKNESKPLAERLSDLFFDENTKEVSELLENLGNLEKQFGLYKKSAKYRERALQIAETVFDKNDSIIADRQSNLANVYRALGNYSQAIDLLEKALANNLKNLSSDDPKVAVSQSNLAIVYDNLGNYTQAAVLLETALASNLKNFGLDQPQIAVSQSNLAIVYGNLGNYEKSATLLEAALASNLKNYGLEHPKVAVSQSNLAIVYRNLGQYDKAIILLEKALATDLKNFGSDHPYIGIRQNNLASVYKSIGMEEEAKLLWTAAYQNFIKTLGEEHPNTILLKKWASEESLSLSL